MENDRTANRVYVGECAGSRSAGQSRKEEVDGYREGLFKKREVWLSGKGKKGKECMIGVNGGGMSGRMHRV